jgi:hypothetical protein
MNLAGPPTLSTPPSRGSQWATVINPLMPFWARTGRGLSRLGLYCSASPNVGHDTDDGSFCHNNIFHSARLASRARKAQRHAASFCRSGILIISPGMDGPKYGDPR